MMKARARFELCRCQLRCRHRLRSQHQLGIRHRLKPRTSASTKSKIIAEADPHVASLTGVKFGLGKTARFCERTETPMPTPLLTLHTTVTTCHIGSDDEGDHCVLPTRTMPRDVSQKMLEKHGCRVLGRPPSPTLQQGLSIAPSTVSQRSPGRSVAEEWIATPRFPVLQNSSVRPVDDGSRSGSRANLFAALCERLVGMPPVFIGSWTRERASSRTPKSQSWSAAGFWTRAKHFEKYLYTHRDADWAVGNPVGSDQSEGSLSSFIVLSRVPRYGRAAVSVDGTQGDDSALVETEVQSGGQGVKRG